MPKMSYDPADEKRGYMEISEERTTNDIDQTQNARRIYGDDYYENVNLMDDECDHNPCGTPKRR